MSNSNTEAAESSSPDMTLEEWLRGRESPAERDDNTSSQTRTTADSDLRDVPASVRSSLSQLADAVTAVTDTPSQTGIRAEYIDAISTLDASLDRVITAGDIEQETEYRLGDIVDTFGSWQAALDAAGIDTQSQIRIEVARLYRELGHPPSPDEMNEHGYVSAVMVENSFDSYEAAVEQVVSPGDSNAYRDAVSAYTDQVVPTGVTVPRYPSGVGAVTDSVGSVLGRTRESSRRAVDAAVTRVGDAEPAAGLFERPQQLLPTTGKRPLRTTLPLSLASLRERRPEVSQDRREFLKYAGVSVTVATGVSSSNGLFGSDAAAQTAQSFGYGGEPVASSPEADGQATTPTPESTPTATPSTGDGASAAEWSVGQDGPAAVDATTGGATDSEGSTYAGDSGGESGTDKSPNPDDPGGSPSPDDPGGSPSPDDPGSSPSPDEPGSSPSPDDPGGSPSPDDPDNSTDGPGSSDNSSATATDRYRSDFTTPEQAYGERGYGGVSTA